MTSAEIGAHWVAALAYVVAALCCGFAVAFGRVRVLDLGSIVLAVGCASNALALALRWSASGHGPYLGRYEAFSSYALAVGLVFLVVRLRQPWFRPGAVVAATAAFLLLGVALLAPSAPTFPSPALRSPWLTIHVSVAKLALATAVSSGAAGLLLLVGANASVLGTAGPSGAVRVAWLDADPLDRLAHRLLGYTFFLMTVVILSGALWARAAWGSFWSWDPVETWSLAFWAGCALVLHTRRARYDRAPDPAQAAAIVTLVVLGVVSFVGYGHFGVSQHAAYVAP